MGRSFKNSKYFISIAKRLTFCRCIVACLRSRLFTNREYQKSINREWNLILIKACRSCFFKSARADITEVRRISPSQHRYITKRTTRTKLRTQQKQKHRLYSLPNRTMTDIICLLDLPNLIIWLYLFFFSSNQLLYPTPPLLYLTNLRNYI